jgi:hypothetical protein
MTWIDWAVVAFVIGISIAAGTWVVRFSSQRGGLERLAECGLRQVMLLTRR